MSCKNTSQVLSPPLVVRASSDAQEWGRSLRRSSSWGRWGSRSSRGDPERGWRPGRWEGRPHPCGGWTWSPYGLWIDSKSDVFFTYLLINFISTDCNCVRENTLSYEMYAPGWQCYLCDIWAVGPKWSVWSTDPPQMWAHPESPPWPHPQRPAPPTTSSASPLHPSHKILTTHIPITVSLIELVDSTQTWQILDQFSSFVRKTQILKHVLHLLLCLRYWTAFQQWKEEDMLRHCHAEKTEMQRKTVIEYNSLLAHYCHFFPQIYRVTYCWKRMLCWGHMPRDRRMLSMSVRMSLP